MVPGVANSIAMSLRTQLQAIEQRSVPEPSSLVSVLMLGGMLLVGQ